MTERHQGVIAAVREAIASRRVSAEETVRLALGRIERLDPALNAVVALRGEEAIAEAQALDRGKGGRDGSSPLAGVPVLVKDLEDVAGMRTTQGSVLFADAPLAKSDGLVPSRLRAAGAIVVGKTNLPEFATEGFTSNILFGTTRNPWALDWSPGGSSGGSAAVVAAGMVPIATATDGGGSIRIPAAFCGLVGLKPSNGVIGRRPIPDWIDFSTDGPLATTVADVRLLLSVERGPVTGDPTALPAPYLAPGSRPAKVYATPRFSPARPLADDVAAQFAAVAAAFGELFDLPVEHLEPEALWTTGDPDDDWIVLATAEHVHRLGREYVKANLERMHPAARWFMEFGLGVSIDDYLAARRRRFGYAKELDELLGADAVILSPTVAAPGFLADGRLTLQDQPGTLPDDVYNTNVANITGNPAISLPAGTSQNGVPFGLHVTAPRFRDELLLDVAEAWEETHGWPRVAPGYESFEVTLGIGS
jgi:Asp-tRNA(Asn)/Glu-tRNA(Gln) amidotransferase A subunit family amidase